jgi:hypothetical protein
MTTATVGVICSIVFGALGFIISYIALNHDRKKDDVEEGQSKGVIASDVGYIKAGVDDLKREGRETRALVGELTQRVTRCEESCKQAHHRIDELHEQQTNN